MELTLHAHFDLHEAIITDDDDDDGGVIVVGYPMYI
jgi:hypothetical protein